MPTTELEIKQLSDNGGSDAIAPITVPDAVIFEDGDTLTEKIDEINAGLIDFTLLANLTNSGTTYQLAESVENFKYVVAVSYYNSFYLNSVEIVKPLWLAGQNVICNFNDGTLRKGQFLINGNTSVTTTSTSTAWSNISGIYLYGVKG